jgi:threonine dehydrogenase-like Zn-dependent dehydrogenase
LAIKSVGGDITLTTGGNMKAIVFHGIGDIRFDDVKEPKMVDSDDAIVRLTASAICGTDLHLVRGTVPGMKSGTILGHEGVGIVEDIGKNIRNLQKGDRVVIASTVGCGFCSYCREGYFSQCDNANPNGPLAGTVFFGGPKEAGSLNGLQAEYARIPYANVGLVKLPDNVGDDDAILLSDIFPTGYFGAKLAEIKPGNVVAVFGCGPVGLFAIMSAYMLGAGRVLAIDHVESRLNMARTLGAEVINFDDENPVEVIRDLTGTIGVDRAIDAVGVDAEMPAKGPAAKEAGKMREQHREEARQVAPVAHPKGAAFAPGDAPSQALNWAVEAVDKAGTISVVGVYPREFRFFPLGTAMQKNLTINSGNCNHRKYIPKLLDMVQSGTVVPKRIITNVQPLASAVDAYKMFDERRLGWIKIEMVPTGKKVAVGV